MSQLNSSSNSFIVKFFEEMQNDWKTRPTEFLEHFWEFPNICLCGHFAWPTARAWLSKASQHIELYDRTRELLVEKRSNTLLINNDQFADNNNFCLHFPYMTKSAIKFHLCHLKTKRIKLNSSWEMVILQSDIWKMRQERQPHSSEWLKKNIKK